MFLQLNIIFFYYYSCYYNSQNDEESEIRHRFRPGTSETALEGQRPASGWTEANEGKETTSGEDETQAEGVKKKLWIEKDPETNQIFRRLQQVQNKTVLYSTAHYSTVYHSTVKQFFTVQCSTALSSIPQHSPIQDNTVQSLQYSYQYSKVQLSVSFSTALNTKVQFRTVQYS